MSPLATLIITSGTVLAVLGVMSLAIWSWQSHVDARGLELTRRMAVSESAAHLALQAADGDIDLLGGPGRWLRSQLQQAHGVAHPVPFLLRMALLGLGGGLLTVWFLDGPMASTGVAVGALPLLRLRALVKRRQADISRQLPDALDLLARSMRAGHGFSEALKSAADELPAPVGVELARVSEQVRLGIPIRDALRDLAARNPENFDLRLVASSILLQRETGGDLIELLSNIAETIRERLLFDRKTAALTAEVRTSAVVLASLPFIIALVLFLIRPGYLVPLIATALGRSMLLAGALSLGVGAIVMQRLAQVEVA